MVSWVRHFTCLCVFQWKAAYLWYLTVKKPKKPNSVILIIYRIKGRNRGKYCWLFSPLHHWLYSTVKVPVFHPPYLIKTSNFLLFCSNLTVTFYVYVCACCVFFLYSISYLLATLINIFVLAYIDLGIS